MNATKTRVSVLLASLNGGTYLQQAVQSLIKQSEPPSELILVDDGSTDGSVAACEQLLVQLADVRVLRHPKPMGLAASLNEALALASGEYIARIDSDDVSLPPRFACQRRVLDANRRLHCVWTSAYFIDADGNRIGATRRIQAYRLPRCVAWRLRTRNIVLHPCVMARRESLLRAGGYRSGFGPAEDHDLWLRMIDQGMALALLPERLAEIRQHDSMTKRNPGAVAVWSEVALACSRIRRSGGDDKEALVNSMMVLSSLPASDLQSITRSVAKQLARWCVGGDLQGASDFLRRVE